MASDATSTTPTLRRPGAFSARYGPWAVVTGASDGIGRASAELLGAAGLNVVLVARRRERLDQLADSLRDRHGIECLVVDVDLAKTDGLEHLFSSTASRDVGLLVAAAGFGTTGPFLSNNIQHELNMLSVNCSAVASATHHFARRFAERGRGGIVLFSSIVAFQGVANTANYAATKAYVQTLGEGLHVELKASGVDVLVSAPGPVASGFGDRADMRMGSAASPSGVALHTLNALGRRITVRPGTRSKVLGYALATAPRRLRTVILTKIIGGFTDHQNEVTA